MEALKRGGSALETVTVAEWIQVSFLRLFNGQNTHIDEPVLYGENVFDLHACISKVNAPTMSRTKQ